jgi:hypothetical protein
VDFRLVCFVIAAQERIVRKIVEGVGESEGFCYIVRKVEADVLMSIVQSIMPLEIEKSCRASQS